MCWKESLPKWKCCPPVKYQNLRIVVVESHYSEYFHLCLTVLAEGKEGSFPNIRTGDLPVRNLEAVLIEKNVQYKQEKHPEVTALTSSSEGLLFFFLREFSFGQI